MQDENYIPFGKAEFLKNPTTPRWEIGQLYPFTVSFSCALTFLSVQVPDMRLAWAHEFSEHAKTEFRELVCEHQNENLNDKGYKRPDFRPPENQDANGKVLRVENGRILASIQHPNPRYGRFRYLFEKTEIPAHIFQDLKRGCSLTVEFDQDVEGGIKAIRVKGFHPATMEPDETPKLIGGAFEDMDRRRENEGKLNARYAAVMDEAHRIREQQTPS